MTKKGQIEHDGIVKSVSDKTVDVTVLVKSACSSCQVQSACNMSDMKQKVITAIRPAFQVSVGDKVTVYASVGNAAFSVVMAYVVPVVLLVMGIVLMQQLGGSELFSACISILIIALYYFILFLFRDKLNKKINFVVEKQE